MTHDNNAPATNGDDSHNNASPTNCYGTESDLSGDFYDDSASDNDLAPIVSSDELEKMQQAAIAEEEMALEAHADDMDDTAETDRFADFDSQITGLPTNPKTSAKKTHSNTAKANSSHSNKTTGDDRPSDQGIPHAEDPLLNSGSTALAALSRYTITNRINALLKNNDPLVINAKNAPLTDMEARQLLASDLIDKLNMMIKIVKAGKSTNAESAQVKPYKRLDFPEIATILTMLHDIVLITPSAANSDPDLDMLAIYDNDVDSETYGTYQASTNHIRRLARHYTYDISTKETAELISSLSDQVPRKQRGENPDLIAMRNGIFNYKTKELIPFSPEYIFLAKAAVDYNPNAQPVVITNPDDGTVWDIDSWIHELFYTPVPDNLPGRDEHGQTDPNAPGFGTPEAAAIDQETADKWARERQLIIEFNKTNEGLEDLVWEIIGATLRPYVSWDKMAFFSSSQGNNGKGTLIEMIRNIIGPQSYASIPLADFSKDFLLEPLTRASAILVDENDVGTFLEKSANLKAVVTNDVITINRKFKSPIAYQFQGFMIQCLNESPKIKDKSESFYRRQLFVPFYKSFTGSERRYIKSDYIKRQDVLEYVVYRALTQRDDYYEFSNPQASQDALNEFKKDNDSLRAFWDFIEEEFVWDMLPRTFLYDLYIAWLNRYNPGAHALNLRNFATSLTKLVTEDGRWEWRVNSYTGKRMSDAEPLIHEYNLENWKNPQAPMNNITRMCTLSPDQIKSKNTGLFRL